MMSTCLAVDFYPRIHAQRTHALRIHALSTEAALVSRLIIIDGGSKGEVGLGGGAQAGIKNGSAGAKGSGEWMAACGLVVR